MGHHLGDQSDPLGTGRVDHLARHRQPSCHRQADDLGESRGHTAARQDTDAGVGVGEHRPLRGHEEVATERHLQPAGERRAVDRADDRRAHLGDGGDAALRSELLEVLQPVALRLLQVDAGAERRIGPGQHHSPNGVVGVGLGQCGVDRPDQVAAQRIPGRGPVHRQQPDRAVVGHEDKRFGHDFFAEIDVMCGICSLICVEGPRKGVNYWICCLVPRC